jgi:cytochrome c5
MNRTITIASTLTATLLLAACSRDEAPPEPAALPQPVATAEPAIDPMTGFKMTGDWEIVRANCVACHSAKLITQQRGSAQQWLTMIRWMQKKQNLWQFDPVTEEKIVTYLAENYPPSDAQRRAALPPEMMPPNPYSPET